MSDPQMFETGTDPFGRPVAWATVERTGEQLDMDAELVEQSRHNVADVAAPSWHRRPR